MPVAIAPDKASSGEGEHKRATGSGQPEADEVEGKRVTFSQKEKGKPAGGLIRP